ncbi:MAG TPA: hypothetical protein VN900_05755, partial [Stellaceae bacterium]|nr:hypothetical protein [Stellaceae bacterium]
QTPAPARPYRRSPVIAMSICRVPQREQTSLSRANRTLRLQPVRTPDALHRTEAKAAAEAIVSCKNRSKPAPDFGRKRQVISAESGT